MELTVRNVQLMPKFPASFVVSMMTVVIFPLLPQKRTFGLPMLLSAELYIVFTAMLIFILSASVFLYTTVQMFRA